MRIIAGTARGRRIEAPEGRNTRPTLDRIRENLFNILQTRIQDSVILDLFAGSGALSFEAISRGASRAVLCDNDRSAYRTEKQNASALSFEKQTEIFCCDWKTALRNLRQRGDKFDLIFLDPPYRMTDLRQVSVQLEDLIAEDGLVILEHEAKQSVEFGNGFIGTDDEDIGFITAVDQTFLRHIFFDGFDQIDDPRVALGMTQRLVDRAQTENIEYDNGREAVAFRLIKLLQLFCRAEESVDIQQPCQAVGVRRDIREKLAAEVDLSELFIHHRA